MGQMLQRSYWNRIPKNQPVLPEVTSVGVYSYPVITLITFKSLLHTTWWSFGTVSLYTWKALKATKLSRKSSMFTSWQQRSSGHHSVFLFELTRPVGDFEPLLLWELTWPTGRLVDTLFSICTDDGFAWADWRSVRKSLDRELHRKLHK